MSPRATGHNTRVGSDKPFILCLGMLSGVYILLIVLMVLADLGYMMVPPNPDNLALMARRSGILEVTPEGQGLRLTIRDPETGASETHRPPTATGTAGRPTFSPTARLRAGSPCIGPWCHRRSVTPLC